MHGDDAEQYDDLIDCGDPYTYHAQFHNPIPHHKIIPLTVNTPHPDADHKKTLEKYFKEHKIFEEPTKQITLDQ